MAVENPRDSELRGKETRSDHGFEPLQEQAQMAVESGVGATSAKMALEPPREGR